MNDRHAKKPFAKLNFAPVSVTATRDDDGCIVLSSGQPLGAYENQVGEMLRRWSEQTPDHTFLAERRDDGGWRRVGYGAARGAADAISQALLDRGLDQRRPVMILSGNGVDHGLLMLGAMQVGIPVAPVSPAYSLFSQDFGKLRHVFELVGPALIYADDGEIFGPALEALDLAGTEIVVSRNPPAGAGVFETLTETVPGPGVDKAFAQVTPDSVAKYLFTSGSTGLPKGVINTQRMLCANTRMITKIWRFLGERPPVLVDWLPWNHTFGGNHNFNLALGHGGTLYIDDGKPAPGLIERSVRNLSEVSPTIYFNVPAGYNMLVPYLERDQGLRDSFFRDLDLMFYGAASLPQDLWQRLEEVAVEARGERVIMSTAWGATETGPVSISAHFPLERAGCVGVPNPGATIKLVPSGAKLELRVKGPHVTPGYTKQPELTAAAFDQEGFYRTGDAVRMIDPDDPARGVAFDGRIAEDFKLSTGTWVSAGQLRMAALQAAAPALKDAVVTGHDRDWLGLLVWLNMDACRELCGEPRAGDWPEDRVAANPGVADHIRAGLAAHNDAHPGSSTRLCRVLVMTEPASIDAGEITDKAYINQNKVLERRRDLVARLYAAEPDSEVILI